MDAPGEPTARPQEDELPPNIVLVLLDDLGWTDFSSFGSKFYETPHIDRLAASGMKLTRAYAASPVCSPTRAALLSGRAPARLRITDWIPGHKPPANARMALPDWTKALPESEVTLPEALAPAGYTSALIGKWHLGPDETHAPERHGFALNRGGTHRGEPPSYFSPYRIPTLPDGPEGEYLTDRLAAEAEAFIERSRSKPFFLFLSHFAVHTPIQAKPALVEKYRAKAASAGAHAPSPQNPAYAAMIESVDDSVGRITRAIERLGLSRRTIVVITSDNGGLLPITSNAPLRAGKATAYEGGVRVPLIVSWPGVVKPGVSDEPAVTMDLFPTLLEAAGVRPDPSVRLDGRSLVPVLRGERPTERAIHFHYPHYHPSGARPHGAIIQGPYRLVEFFEDGRFELYDVVRDPGETRNLATAEPGRATALRQALGAWRTSVGAQMPAPL